jgi:hypothetical protein
MRDRGLVSILGIREPVFLPPFVEEAIFSPVFVYGSFVKDQVVVFVWFYFWVLYSVPFIFISIFVSEPCCFYYYDLVV